MVKIATLFLVAMMVIGFVGRLVAPNGNRKAPRRCTTCGRYLIGRETCTCRAKGRSG
ncbi:MAG: hypothetical protein KDA73_08450 [Rhodobacteraceae bacterium]|nr:hypothetical protein [Paracoccaceae bacterium]